MPDQTQHALWHDPILQELHDVRSQLVERHHGNMSAYSQAAKAHALALGFRFEPIGFNATHLLAEGTDTTASREILVTSTD